MVDEKKPVYAFDFDGVICDSVGESTVSAYRAAKRVWGDEVIDVGGGEGEVGVREGWLGEAMREVRPVVETGWENVALVRVLLEGVKKEGKGVEEVVAGVMRGWGKGMRDEVMDKWGVEKQELLEVFGKVRDEWIEEDAEGWVAANRFYPGVVDVLNGASSDVFLITTKQKRFVEVLLDKFGVKGLSADRIFGLGSGSKIKVLKSLVAKPEFQGRWIDFVEDRYETLEAVSLSMLGQPLKLYLATWGYNTRDVRDRAEKHPFIKTLELPAFTSKFQ